LNALTFDFECNTIAKGNPYCQEGKAICLGSKQNNNPTSVTFDCSLDGDIEFFTDSLCIAFNAKFDIGWLRRLGFALPKQVWCVQLAEYYLSRQTLPWLSLEECSQRYGFPGKLDVVKTQYWDKGVDTEFVPTGILSDYCRQDVDLTYAIYCKQQDQFVQYPKLYKLFKLACQDLLILQDMEWNGLVYNESLCDERATKCKEEMQKRLVILSSVYNGVPINFNSGDQLSAFLYGGTIYEDIKIPDGIFKTGLKKGQPKWKNGVKEHLLPRMVEPLPKSELKKPGVFATDEGTLRKLKGPFASKYVAMLLEVAKLDKLIGTYYEGIPSQNKAMKWEPNMIHGQLNQCVTATGRLSASKPNQQNIAGDVLDVFVSRYND